MTTLTEVPDKGETSELPASLRAKRTEEFKGGFSKALTYIDERAGRRTSKTKDKETDPIEVASYDKPWWLKPTLLRPGYPTRPSIVHTPSA